MKRESETVAEIGKYLSDYGLFFWRTNNIPVFGKNNAGKMTFRALPKYSRKGVPDFVGIFKGKFVGIEVKREKAKLRLEQEQFRIDCEREGGIFILAYSAQDVRDSLRAIL